MQFAHSRTVLVQFSHRLGNSVSFIDFEMSCCCYFLGVCVCVFQNRYLLILHMKEELTKSANKIK